MASKHTGWRKLSKLVPHHVFTDIHWQKLLPVVNGYRVPNHLRNDGRPTRPTLNDLFFIILVQLVGDCVESMDTMDGRIAPQNVTALPPTARRRAERRPGG